MGHLFLYPPIQEMFTLERTFEAMGYPPKWGKETTKEGWPTITQPAGGSARTRNQTSWQRARCSLHFSTLVKEIPCHSGKTSAINGPCNNGKSLHLSEQWFPQLKNGDSANCPVILTGLLWEGKPIETSGILCCNRPVGTFWHTKTCDTAQQNWPIHHIYLFNM